MSFQLIPTQGFKNDHKIELTGTSSPTKAWRSLSLTYGSSNTKIGLPSKGSPKDLVTSSRVNGVKLMPSGLLDPVLGDNAELPMTPGVRQFVESQGLHRALGTAVELIQKHFTLVAPLVLTIDDDHDRIGSRHLVIEAPVSGDPSEVSKSHWLFALESAGIAEIAAHPINLICDIR